MKFVANILLTTLTTTCFATIFNEIEPNNTPQTANRFFNAESEDVIRGQNFNELDPDYFEITARSRPDGFYRHQLWASSDGQQFMSIQIEGLWRNASQIPFGQPARRWYTFGGGSAVKISTAVTTQFRSLNYELDYQSPEEPMNVIDLGTFGEGVFRFKESEPFEVFDFHVLDSDGNIVPGGSETPFPPNAQINSVLNLNLRPGRYYFITAWGLQSNAYAISQNFPFTGERNFFAMANAAGRVPVRPATVTITTPTATIVRPIGEDFFTSQEEMLFYSFNVVPEPATFVAFGVGLLALLKKRKK